MSWGVSTYALARIATAGIVAFIAMIVLLHALEPELSADERMVSEYALGDYGLLLNAAAMFLALGSMALAIGLQRALRPTSLLPSALLATWSISAVGVGLFNTDPEGATETTTTGAIHTVAVMAAVLALIAAAFLYARCFQGHANWRRMASATHWWALAMLVATVAIVLAAESEIGGIVQRIWLAVLLGWLALAANHLRSVSRPGAKGAAEGAPIRTGADRALC